MAMYYYACRLSAAAAGCGGGRTRRSSSGGQDSPPPHPAAGVSGSQHQPLSRVSTICRQPGPSSSSSLLHQAKSEELLTAGRRDSEDDCTTSSPFHADLSQTGVVYREGNLASGSLEALIQHMVPSSDYYPDRAFLFAFLLSSRLFIKPHELLGNVLAKVEDQLKAKSATPKTAGPSEPVIRLIGEWSETFPYDFRDERVMCHVRRVAEACVGLNEDDETSQSLQRQVSSLLQSLLDKLTSLERYEAYIRGVKTQAVSGSALAQTEVSELCGSAVSLAQQLTHIELERLSYIGPEEFVQAFAKESYPASLGENLVQQQAEPNITHNYQIYAEWFPRLVALVLTDILRIKRSKKQRVRTVEFWIETAKHCFEIGNFNSLMAIIAGLNKLPISRLKKTWSGVDRSELNRLEREVSFCDDYCSYRNSLRSAAVRGGKSSLVVPLFSLLGSDLRQLTIECRTPLANGHINFEKFWQLAKQVTEFITWKQVHCPFPKSAKVITYLQATPVLSEDAGMLASFECEPPETSDELDLHQKLLSAAHTS